MPEPHLENHVIKIRQLIEDYRSGRIVIPEFQREYVWRRSKAPKLIDSLYKGFPISSLLLWLSAEETRSRRRDPRPSRAALMSWLIDGQQRVITLSRCMNGDEGIDVVFHPDRQEFGLTNAATQGDPNWYRLSEIWDDETYRNLRRNLPPGPKGEIQEERFERARRILDYEVPTVRMVDHSFQNAVDAFTRINTLGVKLKKEDIESAQVAARHTGFIADEVQPFLANLRGEGFTRINVMHLFRACAFVARPDGRDRTPLHELDRREVQSAWNQTKRALLEGIGLVRSEFGLVNMDILWSGALLVPVMALCATLGPRERDARAITAWLAIAALLHRYSKSTETALDQDLRACRNPDPIGALLTNVRRHDGEILANPDDFGGALADKSALLAMYIACHYRGLKDLFSGANILLQSTIDRHHILPRAQFPERQRPSADCIANIAFISGSANRRHVENCSPKPSTTIYRSVSRIVASD
ncbi:MAG: DUF262 domain-containing protein [Deltaproteobacteria bacterium]|nr:DUF262 domain-containing protein [Deltaproteobacteria bacterium]